MATRVLVLGASGMLGAMVFDWLSRDGNLDVIGTVRQSRVLNDTASRLHKPFVLLDAENSSDSELAQLVQGVDWIINAIGIIKPYIHDDNAVEVEQATRVNALFPHRLARAAESAGARVIQIATDCVYSGQKGQYLETDVHDALDVYGKTKSVGEVYAPNIIHLRCSIIGPEPRAHVSLLDWFLGQKRGSGVNGFTNHQWNGVTTLQFARLCQGLITSNGSLKHSQHIVPASSISKAELLNCFAKEYNRDDVVITPVEAKTVIDRTLTTNDETANRILWQQAGYPEPPTVPQMVSELARFDFSFSDKNS
jgi:dTDP-4-dehydrorhamnose reductase